MRKKKGTVVAPILSDITQLARDNRHPNPGGPPPAAWQSAPQSGRPTSGRALNPHTVPCAFLLPERGGVTLSRAEPSQCSVKSVLIWLTARWTFPA